MEDNKEKGEEAVMIDKKRENLLFFLKVLLLEEANAESAARLLDSREDFYDKDSRPQLCRKQNEEDDPFSILFSFWNPQSNVLAKQLLVYCPCLMKSYRLTHIIEPTN